MTTAPRGPNRSSTNPAAIDPWKMRDLLILGVGFPLFLGAMFFAFFFGLGNGS